MASVNAILSLAFFVSATLALPWDLQGFSYFHYAPEPEAPYQYSYPTAGVSPTAPVSTGTGAAPTGVFPTAYPTAPVPSGYGRKRNIQERYAPSGYPFPTGTGFATGTGFPAPTGSFPGGYDSHPVLDLSIKQYGGPRGHGHQPYYPFSYGPEPPSYPTSAVTAPTAPAPTGTAPAPTAS